MGTKGDVMKIGFIGLGRMGFALVSSLVKKDQTVFVYDINQSAMEKLAAAGAKPAASVADVCREADLVFTMLPGPKQVKEVALGDGGVVQSLKPGAVYIDMSTVDIETVDVVHAACEKAGIAFGDAPVGRLAAHADRGESLFMLGIDEAHRETVEPVLYLMGTTVHYCGQAGSGTRTKLVNNMMVLCYCQINSEALVLAKALGLDVRKTFDVITSTTANNGQLKEKWPNKVLGGDLSPGFDIALGFKDISLASGAAQMSGISLPVCDMTRNVFRMALNAGKAGQDTSCLTDFWAEINSLDKIRL
ncbi:MAG TPA: NAD(P)-dependent oxidoreductase [Burkholderiaceae bacterium]|nr:NAD(P)-dependent oxidoreductase [Burkholderiaceae bacterium]